MDTYVLYVRIGFWIKANPSGTHIHAVNSRIVFGNRKYLQSNFTSNRRFFYFKRRRSERQIWGLERDGTSVLLVQQEKFQQETIKKYIVESLSSCMLDYASHCILYVEFLIELH